MGSYLVRICLLVLQFCWFEFTRMKLLQVARNSIVRRYFKGGIRRNTVAGTFNGSTLSTWMWVVAIGAMVNQNSLISMASISAIDEEWIERTQKKFWKKSS